MVLLASKDTIIWKLARTSISEDEMFLMAMGKKLIIKLLSIWGKSAINSSITLVKKEAHALL
jgi:hypothetical protein